ncbi:hypothetical protein [Siansivirga zeaxanthinifaciens]|uniref:Uncharacterized protein n=1 Tax=Siansivirga zeaxanthinifaciens CC-SAMT-1 TaxID=1454006 RepID=A0A0C5WPM9_9FLAO|nr:hypothetical protein [Siansivirga zeaxanthinifaciens]AJR04885.1 hypothetical protein AW14_08175 [Siansivirga zeaxanthinifaciens CC-SAMT-1]
MGGEGAMMAAINSLKNNRSLMSKRKENKPFSGSYAGIELKEFPKASKTDLLKIREKLQRENKIRTRKHFVILTLVLVIFAFIIYRYLF